MVKKGWRILLAIAVMLLVFFLWPAPNEPSYQGKRLSQWVSQCYYANDSTPLDQAENALRKIGTNAIPCLLDWLQYQPGPWRMRMDAVRMQLSYRVRSSKSVSRAFNDWGQTRADYTTYCFRVLGDIASPAAPGLTRIAKTGPSIEVSLRAMHALSGIGSNGLPGLISIANDSTVDAKRRITSINLFPYELPATNSLIVLPCLVRCIEDKDPLVAAAATHGLGRMHAEPDLSIPALTKACDNPQAVVRIRAVVALSEFGTNAMATNALAKALNDPDSRIQEAARAALERAAARQ